MALAARYLHTKIPAGELAGGVTPSVSTITGNLTITAAWSDPTFAAQLANAVAQAEVTRSNQATSAQFSVLAKDIQGRIASLTKTANGKPSAQTSDAGQELLVYTQELARIQSVGQFARSAQIAAFAVAPGSATSPDKVRSTVLGFVLGLLLGIVFAFVRDTLDRHLRNPRDIESSFKFPVLGYVRNDAMGQLAYQSNGSGGRDKQLDVEAFRIVRRNLEFLSDSAPPRTILVTSGLPEEGKTTVAGSLAFAMAAAGRTTLLVDCDLRRPALADRLELERSPGISDFLVNGAKPEEILRTVQFSEPVSLNGSNPAGNGDAEGVARHQFVFVPAGSITIRATEALGSPRFKEFLAQVRQVYDVVILDSSPLLPVADTLEILPLVDAVVFCARERKATKATASAARAAFAHLPDRPTGLVVTGVKPRRGDAYGYAYYGYS
jgi:Mrp family chromosome partitioning ATPase